MSFKGLFGIALIIFGAYLLFGEPAKAEWPPRLGTAAIHFMKLCVDFYPYSGILAVVLGIATLMSIRKY